MTYIKYRQISIAKESKGYDISLFYVILNVFFIKSKRFPFENNRERRKHY